MIELEELIKNYFKDKKDREFCYGNHVNYKAGIVTYDKEKAFNILNKIKENNIQKVNRFITSTNRLELRLNNGDVYVWVRPIENSRGYRFKTIYIDKNITYEFFKNVLPIIGMYCSEENVHVI